jgi:hypothetical protein
VPWVGRGVGTGRVAFPERVPLVAREVIGRVGLPVRVLVPAMVIFPGRTLANGIAVLLDIETKIVTTVTRGSVVVTVVTTGLCGFL